jgi:hypothetical protein
MPLTEAESDSVQLLFLNRICGTTYDVRGESPNNEAFQIIEQGPRW